MGRQRCGASLCFEFRIKPGHSFCRQCTYNSFFGGYCSQGQLCICTQSNPSVFFFNFSSHAAVVGFWFQPEVQLLSTLNPFPVIHFSCCLLNFCFADRYTLSSFNPPGGTGWVGLPPRASWVPRQRRAFGQSLAFFLARRAKDLLTPN